MSEYLKRLKKIERGLGKIKNVNRDAVEYKDDLDHYFLDCFSFKEYIKNDKTVHEKVKQTVEPYLNKNIYLRLCADLANRDKHLTLDKHKRDDGEITSSNVDIQMQHTIFVSGTDLRISLLKSKNGKVEEYDKFKNDIEPIISQNNSSNSNAAMLNQSYVVTADNGRIYDAFSLAEECYKAWINFLIQHNLPKP